jgi:hypothetical protein
MIPLALSVQIRSHTAQTGYYQSQSNRPDAVRRDESDSSTNSRDRVIRPEHHSTIDNPQSESLAHLAIQSIESSLHQATEK